MSDQGFPLMKKIVLAITTMAIALGAVATADAAINVRQLNQQRLIDAGYRSGKLTGQERDRLKAQQRSIAAQENRMRARHHGHLTARDERILHVRQDQAKREIQREKYDAQRGRNRLKL
jgi:opacity protein-like surface antigen